MTKPIAHICTFTTGLDELTRKQHADARAVLRVLAEHKRFSVFEATANPTIAATMDRLGEQGYIKSAGGTFPWCEVEITEAGQAFLDEEKEKP